MRLLDRLDHSRLKAILIQYSDNDFGENEHFFENGNSLKVMDENEFYEMQRLHSRQNRYKPGEHVVKFVPFFIEKIWSRLDSRIGLQKIIRAETQQDATETEARYFLNALLNAGLPPDVDIYIFEINGRAKNDSVFAEALKRLLELKQPPELITRIRVLNLSSGLTNDKFFVLDDHINQDGHTYIAEMLRKELGCNIKN